MLWSVVELADGMRCPPLADGMHCLPLWYVLPPFASLRAGYQQQLKE